MLEVPAGSNPTRVPFFRLLFEDKIFENSKSQCYRILMVYVLSILHCRTNSGQITQYTTLPAVRIDTAYLFTGSRARLLQLAARSGKRRTLLCYTLILI